MIGQKPKIQSLTGLKVIAILFIIYHHIGGYNIFNVGFDVGARMCEFFFVVSGFLVGYNSYQKVLSGEYDKLNHSKSFLKKFMSMWPLHFILLICSAVVNTVKFGAEPVAEKFPIFLSNFFLLQSWSPDPRVYFSYNGASWFVCSILFCYFVAPIMTRRLKDIRQSGLLFVLCVLVRLALELFSTELNFQFFPFDVHVSPIIRCLEFAIGLFSVPVFFCLQEKVATIKKPVRLTVFSFLEAAVAAGTMALFVLEDKQWIRGYFVIILWIMTFTFAFEGGIFSQVLSIKPFRFLNSFQYEIYLSHMMIASAFNYVLRKLFPTFSNAIVIFILDYIVILTVCFAYHKLAAPLIAKLNNKIFKFDSCKV